ncbi:DNA-binding protein RFXANK-like [Centruroides sculpturatus]|uniref:DNA-binding protein RFXANK-like n=1 Tax=Centruroides sculpturatus TaxID=218467 RepID=UPI000C6C9BD2|nr:DNA-binding protein RFXANK-like [Centruroides sculpturatus]
MCPNKVIKDLPSTVLTNLQRGNVQTQTACQLPERSVHQLAAQGELFSQHFDEDNSLLNVQDNNGFTPLLWASACGQLATVRLLLEKNANVNIGGKRGETALLFASANGHAHIVRKLLQHKADVNETDQDGNTSLMYAAFCNHALCVHELLTAGADITKENNNKDTAFNIAIRRGSKQVQAVMEKYMLNLLLKAQP